MNWEVFEGVMTVAGFTIVIVFGPRWERRWLLTVIGAIGVTAVIGLGIAVLL